MRPLYSSIESLKHERGVTGYIENENRLENQAWYLETYQALRLFTEVLRALFTALDLLKYQDDNDEDTQALRARSSTATQLHFQISLVEQKLHADAQHDTEGVSND